MHRVRRRDRFYEFGCGVTRAYSDIRQVDADITDCLRVIRECMNPVDDTREDYALCALECFVDIALRIMRKTNPSKIRSVAMTVEIKARMDGKPVVRGVA